MKYFLTGQLVYSILTSLYIAFYRPAKLSTRVKLIALQFFIYILLFLGITDIYSIDLSIKNVIMMNISTLLISEYFLRYSKIKNSPVRKREEEELRIYLGLLPLDQKNHKFFQLEVPHSSALIRKHPFQHLDKSLYLLS